MVSRPRSVSVQKCFECLDQLHPCNLVREHQLTCSLPVGLSSEHSDPGSHTFYGTGKDSSGIEVAEKGVDYYSYKDVPHGDVRIRPCFSKTTGKWRRCFVYTPPDYDTNGSARYPVLYLQQGSGDPRRRPAAEAGSVSAVRLSVHVDAACAGDTALTAGRAPV